VPHIKDVVKRFAREGYVAIAPDLYHGKSTVEAAEAQHLMQKLDWNKAAQEVAGAVAYLRKRGCPRVGVVGFCMGGALALIAAATAGVDAAVAFYGFPPDPKILQKKCPPVLIFFGEKEEFFDVAAAKAWAEDQRAQKVATTEVIVYPGAGHAFFNDTRLDVYHRDSARDAWKRTLAHFAKYVR
jgi:carboxymethylenebutenolidase